MKYLFGDATPFPLEENFLDTLVVATDACVGLLRIDEEAERRRHEAEQARLRANAEIAQLDGIGKAVEQVLARHLTEGAPVTPSQAVAQRIIQSVESTIKSTRTAIARRRDATLTDSGLDDGAGQVIEVLSEFLCQRELPETTWRLRWKASENGEGQQAHLVGLAKPIDLQAVFEVELPEQHLWRRPVRVSQLAQGVRLSLNCQRRWPRTGSKWRQISIEKYLVTEVEVSPERKSLVLRKPGRGAVQRLELIVESEANSQPLVRWLDGSGPAPGPSSLRESELEAVERLWEMVATTISDLVNYRSRVILATLRKSPIRDLRPVEICQAILDAVGPLTREMRQRSRIVGEITLKRELSDGKREELFIPKERIAGKFASLPPQYRSLFDIFGLDATGEIAINLPARSAPQPAPARARVARGSTPPPVVDLDEDASTGEITPELIDDQAEASPGPPNLRLITADSRS
jgi:hypothetical protein